MAIFDNKTAESIKNNSKLLLTISRERIWEEFRKSWEQSKDFRDYLNYLDFFHLYEYIFPGAKINTELINSKDFVVVIANLFKNENPIGLSNKLSQGYKIPLDISTKVAFLISLFSFSPDDVFDFYKRKQQCGISNETILEWIRVQNLDNLFKFLDYVPTISAQELMSQGYSGRELGIKIKQLETEKFKKML